MADENITSTEPPTTRRNVFVAADQRCAITADAVAAQ